MFERMKVDVDIRQNLQELEGGMDKAHYIEQTGTTGIHGNPHMERRKQRRGYSTYTYARALKACQY
jgi:hypothetical protein